MAAMLARRVARPAAGWWQAGHGTSDPLHERALTGLLLHPLTRLDLSVEDGAGARLGLGVLDAAAFLLADG
jgi:nicotinate-nucleotide--dimethylbenzimidazole phosphoribosyltransferase